jgi:ribosome-associated toxin RatA of RatAB toxin-antitoxin module
MQTLTAAMPPTGRRWLRRLGVLLASAAVSIAASAGPTAAQAPLAGTAFDVEREGASINVRASAIVHADRATVWRTLVDYGHLPDFIPDMQTSELLERQGNDLLVRQVGRAGLGPFSQTFSVTLAVRESPMREIDAQAIGGDFERFRSSYVISAVDGAGGTRIDFVASIESKAVVPPLIGLPVMRMVMRRQFDALLAEAERRAASMH